MMDQLPPIRILVADNHPLVCSGISAVLEAIPAANLKVVGQAQNGDEMVNLFAQLQPDIGLVDLRMPIMNGTEAIKHIRSQFSEARLIILTTYKDDKDIIQGVKAGARGVLFKDANPEEIIKCIQDVHNGERPIPSTIMDKIIDEKSDVLTPKEIKVLQLVAKGMTNAEIGKEFNIVKGTVTQHMFNILSKLGAKNRIQAVNIARKQGLIS